MISKKSSLKRDRVYIRLVVLELILLLLVFQCNPIVWAFVLQQNFRSRIPPSVFVASTSSKRSVTTTTSTDGGSGRYPSIFRGVPRIAMSSLPSSPWSPSSEEDRLRAEKELKVWPLDEYNAKLLNEVSPKDWNEQISREESVNCSGVEDKNVEVYDLVVIGAGAGGLVSSRQAARRGAKSVMISSHMAGGDCLNVGCVPSKALIRCARSIREVARSHEYGVILRPEGTTNSGALTRELVGVDFGKIMERMRRLRSEIAPVDGHARGRDVGVTVCQGFGRFVDERTVEVVSSTSSSSSSVVRRFRFHKAVIATGGTATVPSNVPTDCPYTTHETLFNLSELPPRMVVLGSGVVALEMAQTFAAFGSSVTVLMRGEQLFPRAFDEDAGPTLQKALEKGSPFGDDNLTFLTQAELTSVETLRDVEVDEKGQRRLPLLRLTVSVVDQVAETTTTTTPRVLLMDCECLLVATGRTANVHGLNLEAANVPYDEREGILVNDLSQSVGNPNVYSVGDCTAGVPRLTHMSGEMAKLVVQNALFDDEWKLSSLVVPSCMYTEPEYATVGSLPPGTGNEYDIYQASLQHNDRAILESGEGSDDDRHVGYAKIFCAKGTGTVLACSVVADRAGEIIHEIGLAIKHDITLEGIGRNIHCYPTTGEVVMSCGIQLINSKWKLYDSKFDDNDDIHTPV